MLAAAATAVVLGLLLAAIRFVRRDDGPQNYLGDVTARWRRR